LLGFSTEGWGQTSRLYLQRIQTQSGSDSYVRDVAEAQGSAGTVSLQSTTNNTFIETLAFTRDFDKLNDPNHGDTYSVSVDYYLREPQRILINTINLIS